MLSITRIGLGALALLALASGGAGCASPTAETTGSSAASAFTEQRGDEFVVSATPERIVLRKQVDEISLPFNPESLTHRAILIHPIKNVTETGVYSRAEKVRDAGETWVIDAKPMTFDEMEGIQYDEVARVYLAAGIKPPLQIQSAPSLDLGAIDTSVHPLAGAATFSGFAFTGINLGTGFDFGPALFLRPGVSFSHTIQRAKIDAKPLLSWTHEDGLEIGFHASFDWKSTVTIGGKISGEFYRSPTLSGPPVPVLVPIAGIPVPAVLEGKAFVSCSAMLDGISDLTATITATAEIGTSMRVQQYQTESGTGWVRQGSIPNKLTGTGSVTLANDLSPKVSVMCMVPRLEVHAEIAGIAGPYLAMMPTLSAGPDGTTFETKLAAGVGAGFVGLGTGVEVNFYSWTPGN